MIEMNGKEEQIEIKEYLTFSGTVQPVYDEFVESAKDEIADLDPADYDLENDLTEFINHKLTHEDKIEILECIEDQFDRMENYYDNVSIFDREIVLVPAVQSWISGTFGVEIEI